MTLNRLCTGLCVWVLALPFETCPPAYGQDEKNHEKVCIQLSAPTNSLELIRNVEFAFSRDYFLVKAFYEDAYLRCVFGGKHFVIDWIGDGEQVDVRVSEKPDVPRVFNIGDHARNDTPYAHRIILDAIPDGAYEAIGIDFSQIEDKASFDELKKYFGSRWRLLDQSALSSGDAYAVTFFRTEKHRKEIIFFFSKEKQLVNANFLNGEI